MSKPCKARLPDPAEMAFSIMQRVAGEAEPSVETAVDAKKSKAGKIGGAKGGRARAAILTTAEKKAISTKAAKARWAK